jgi:hypothetical protein
VRVDLPSDLHGLHHLKRARLAKEISGRDDLTTEEADAVIAAELERRGGVVLSPVEKKPEPDEPAASKPTRRAVKRRTGDAE